MIYFRISWILDIFAVVCCISGVMNQADAAFCTPTTCQNGGTCIEGLTNYTCGCAPGYTGNTCQTDVNECSSSPCQNGGRCEDHVNSFSCACSRQYTGTLCEIAVTCTQLPRVFSDVIGTIPSTLLVGTTLTYGCLAGYKPKTGASQVTCLDGGYWDNTQVLQCEEITCAYAVQVNNATAVGSNKTQIGTAITYVCYTDQFFPDGTAQKTIECLSSGYWNETITASCHSVICPEAPVVVNVSGSGYERSLDTVLTYSCHLGHVYPDSSSRRTITCLSSSQWSASVPVCKPVQCPVPPAIRNGSVTVMGRYFRDISVYTCHQGYKFPDGTDYTVIECTTDAQWSKRISDCKISRCPPLFYVENSQHSAYNVTAGSKVTVNCNQGYFFNNSIRNQEVTCLYDERWWPVLESCKPIHCPVVQAITHASANGNATIYGTTNTFTCDTGFHYIDNTTEKSITCMETGAWNLQLQQNACQAIYCKPAETIPSASTKGSDTTYGAKIKYACSSGARFSDGTSVKTITCAGHGEWSETGLSCKSNRCAKMPVVVNGAPLSPNVTYGSIVAFHCHQGYEFPDGNKAKITACRPDATWEPAAFPDCIVQNCTVSIGYKLLASIPTASFAASINYTCEPGYGFTSGESHVVNTCEEDGFWNRTVPECRAILCPGVPVVGNASTDTTNHSFSAVVNYTCDVGMEFPQGRLWMTSRCTETGQWEPLLSACQTLHCSPVPVWFDNKFNATDSIYETVVEYNCTPGYALPDKNTQASSRCGRWKLWEPIIEECKEINHDKDAWKGDPVDAEGSQYIGSGLVVLVFLLLGLLILMDAPKLIGDIKLGILRVLKSTMHILKKRTIVEQIRNEEMQGTDTSVELQDTSQG